MGWIEDYMVYASNNECLPGYHYYTGVTILGAALRRNVAFSKNYYKVFPSLWTLIIGPSGSKKTTALTIGYNILSKLDHVHLLADRLTPEALTASLGEKDESGNVESQGLLYAPELSTFLDRRQHNEGMVQLLLRLADCPDRWVYETRGGGKVPLRNVAVTFLGATANDLLYECIPPLALKSGFLARFICVVGKEQLTGIPFPWKDEQLEREVTNSLYQLSLLKGDMVLPPKARDWYMDWYFRHKAIAARESSTKFRAYYERKPDHLLKLAMILSISESGVLQFSVKAFELALAKLEETEADLPELYAEVDASDAGRFHIKLLEQIERSPNGLSHVDLLRRNHTSVGDATTIKKIMITLVDAGLIAVERKSGAVWYRRKRRPSGEGL